MPTIRPFRALRYDPEVVGDVSLVLSPPADALLAADQRELLARHPRNAVRLDLPAEELGDEPDDRYRRAARTYATWRADGTFHRDRRPSLYAHEQAYRIPGTDLERVQRGFFTRLHLERPGPGATVLPTARASVAAREDRYRLLRASAANVGPVVGLFGDATGRATGLLATIARRAPDLEIVDDGGTRHRLWAIAETASGTDPDASEPDDPDAGIVAELVTSAEAGSVTIVDGHDRYEAALRYRDERRGQRTDGEEPFDYVLALLLPEDQQLTVLPVHRVIRDLGDDGVAALRDGLGELFESRAADAVELDRRFGTASMTRGGGGRFGFWSRHGGALLEARRDALVRHLPAGGEAFRRLDVTVLRAALGRIAGIDPADDAEGPSLWIASAAEALRRVDGHLDGADAAFLLEPPPMNDIVAVARAGDLIPEGSASFFPRAPSGLVVNPHEW